MGAPKEPKPLRNIGGAVAMPFVLQPGFTENPERPSPDYFCAAVSSVMDHKGDTHRAYKWLLRSEKVKALRRMAAKKLSSLRRDDAKVAQQRNLQSQTILRVLFDLKKHRHSFYKF